MSGGEARLTAGTARTLLGREAGSGGYRRLAPRPGEVRVIRRDIGGVEPSERLRPLLRFVHLSDLHVTDSQSPARAEFFDRLSDPDSPWLSTLGLVETYRPQEMLSAHVVESMAAAVRSGAGLPSSEVDFAIVTGDATDNAQRNELDNYLALMGGGTVRPDSGNPSGWEGVGGSWGPYDPYYWHPDGAPRGERADRPTSLYGFPTVRGLLDASRAPWHATGLGVPWYAVYGNHDTLLCGTLAAGPVLQRVTQGTRKLVHWGEGADLTLLTGHANRPPDVARAVGAGTWTPVSADGARRFVDRYEWINTHLEATGTPRGHGLTTDVLRRSGVYYGFDAGPFRALVLDTNNPFGGWQGSLDADQVAWLEAELDAAARRPVLLFSHHPIDSLTNDYVPDGTRGGNTRIVAGQVWELLCRHPNVIAWFNGHTHCNTITPVGDAADSGSFWQVTTGSHIDWPQQARVVEVLHDQHNDQLVVATTPLDHGAPVAPSHGGLADPVALASWSRELTFNDYQKRVEGARGARRANHGSIRDRCTALVLPLAGRAGRRPLTLE